MPVDPTYINVEPTGDVWIRDFDKGIVETMGGEEIDSYYYLDHPKISDVRPPPFPDDYQVVASRGTRMPGVPIKFTNSDDRITDFILPCIVVRRESWEEALGRWPSIHLKYRAPAPGASPVEITRGTTPEGEPNVINGFDQYEQQYGGFPYDITYLISVLTQGLRATSDAQTLLKHVMRTYKPRGSVIKVMDSVGSERLYDAFASGPTDLKEALDIVDKQGGYSLSVKVLGQIDLNEPMLTNPATSIDFNYQSGVS